MGDIHTCPRAGHDYTEITANQLVECTDSEFNSNHRQLSPRRPKWFAQSLMSDVLLVMSRAWMLHPGCWGEELSCLGVDLTRKSWQAKV